MYVCVCAYVCVYVCVCVCGCGGGGGGYFSVCTSTVYRCLGFVTCLLMYGRCCLLQIDRPDSLPAIPLPPEKLLRTLRNRLERVSAIELYYFLIFYVHQGVIVPMDMTRGHSTQSDVHFDPGFENSAWSMVYAASDCNRSIDLLTATVAQASNAVCERVLVGPAPRQGRL